MIMTGAVMMCTNIANAAGIGYIELSKVLKNYTYAQQIAQRLKIIYRNSKIYDRSKSKNQ